MKNKKLRRPATVIAIGLVLALVVCLLVNTVMTPKVTAHSFPYSVTYRLSGETKTLDGVYTCSFNGHSKGASPNSRNYTGEYTVGDQTTDSQTYTVAQKDGAELYIVTAFNSHYLMGDTKAADYEPFLNDPYLEAIDKEGYPCGEAETAKLFEAEIISWEYPEPIENAYVFSGFSALHQGSMFAMLAVGLLTLLACMIFVKRDKAVPYLALDKLSIVANFLVCLAALPFITLIATLLQLTMGSDDLLYQLCLCMPALTAFAVAASVSLRRTGFTKTGFFIQFIGPVLFAVPFFFESAF